MITMTRHIVSVGWEYYQHASTGMTIASLKKEEHPYPFKDRTRFKTFIQNPELCFVYFGTKTKKFAEKRNILILDSTSADLNRKCVGLLDVLMPTSAFIPQTDSSNLY